MRWISRVFLSAAAVLLAPGAVAAQQAQTYRLAGPAEIYDLVGAVTLVPGQGQVSVTVQRQGSDAGQLRVAHEGGSLRVIYPGSRVVYDRMEPGSRSELRIEQDGRFGHGGRRVVVAGSGDGTHAWADLEIAVPREGRVVLHLGVGQVTVRNVAGDLRLDTSSADVTAEGTSGRLDVDVGSGDVRVTAARGSVRLDTGSGDVTLERLDVSDLYSDTGSGETRVVGLTAPTAHLETGSGDIQVSGVRVPRLELETGSGDIDATLQSDVGDLSIDTGSGNATLRLPESLGATLEVDTGTGDIDSDFPVTVTHRGRGSLEGRIGDGQGRIRIETGSGDVRLLRS